MKLFFAAMTLSFSGPLLAAEDPRVEALSACYSDVIVGFVAKQNSVSVELARDALKGSPEAFVFMFQAAKQTVDLYDSGGDVSGQISQIDSELPGTSPALQACYKTHVVESVNSSPKKSIVDEQEATKTGETSYSTEEKARADIACLKLGNTVDGQHLERIEIIMEFGITNPSQIEITKNLVEIGFMLKENNCADTLLEGLYSPLNK